MMRQQWEISSLPFSQRNKTKTTSFETNAIFQCFKIIQSTRKKRHRKANNSYVGEDFNPEELVKFVMYFDANNLYGWAMCKPLPIGGFKWLSDSELQDWKNHPCILEVDLEYLKELNDHPLAPERLKIGNVEKLIPNLRHKKKYVVHHESLTFYESLGLKITIIHRGIKFKESTSVLD